MKDRKNWDEKYRDADYLGDPSLFLVQVLPQLPHASGARALDVASGLGANALLLSTEGFVVDALDWSFEALRKCGAKARLERLPVHPVVCDLTRIPLPRERYDVVASFRFLERSLWPRLVRTLKPGGALVIETFTVRHLEHSPDFPRGYLLEEGELLSAFGSTLRVVRYQESKSESTASLLALR